MGSDHVAAVQEADHVAAVQELVGVDFASVDAVGVARVLGLVRQVEGFLASVKVRGARRLEELREVGAAGRVEVTTGRLWGKAGAREIQRRSDALAGAPGLEEALVAGAITARHVDLFAGAVAATPEVAEHHDELARVAVTMGPDEFGQVCRRMALLLGDREGVEVLERQRRESRVRRWVDQVTGMYCVRAELDPERGARVWAALDAEIERHFHSGVDPGLDSEQRAAAAVHAICARGGGGSRVGATVHVHVDLDTLVAGLREGSTVDVTGGGVAPVATIRRMACEAEIIPYVLNGDGVVVDVGRAARLATAPQRHALRAMYSTCAMPDCRVGFEHTTIHHLAAFAHGGATDMANLIPVCSRHHHDLHEGGWTAHLDPTTRQLTVTRPDGAVTHTRLRPRTAA